MSKPSKKAGKFDGILFIIIATFIVLYWFNNDVPLYFSFICVIFIVLILVIIAFFLVRKIFRKKKLADNETILPPIQYEHRYQARPFLSPAEHFFYQHLLKVTPNTHIIQCKVGLWGIVENIFPEDWPRISQKQLDFILYNTATNTVSLVIELDDSSHVLNIVRKRDNAKDAILSNAGIPILRIKTSREYNIDSIRQRIQELLK